MRRLAVVGPRGSGKTHLAHVWAARAGRGDPGRRGAARPRCRRRCPETRRWWSRMPTGSGRRTGGRGGALSSLQPAGGRRGSLMLSGREPPARWPAAAARPREPAGGGAGGAAGGAGRRAAGGGAGQALRRPADRGRSRPGRLPGQPDGPRLRRGRGDGGGSSTGPGSRAHRPITARLAAELLYGEGEG